MVLSMTGYGRAGALLHGRDIKVELRSVNARFFEYSSRLPRSCAFLEDELKKLRQNAAELASIEAQLSDVKKYVELEKLLPAAEAKKSAAQTRLTELLTYAEKTRTAIDGINAEILTLAKAQAGVDELQGTVRGGGCGPHGGQHPYW